MVPEGVGIYRQIGFRTRFVRLECFATGRETRRYFRNALLVRKGDGFSTCYWADLPFKLLDVIHETSSQLS